jgi:hypothetical protein
VRRGFTLIEALIVVVLFITIVAIIGLHLYYSAAGRAAREAAAQREAEYKAAFDASFPIPEGTVVWESKQDHYHLVLRLRYNYALHETDEDYPDQIVKLCVDGKYRRPIPVDNHPYVTGIATTDCQVRQCYPDVVLAIPSKDGFDLEPQDIMLPLSFGWKGRGEYSDYSWSIPVSASIRDIKWHETLKKE